jgi:multidrug resistance efflux pump
MKSKVWIVAVLFVVGVVGAVAIARSSQSSDVGEWNASGFIEADIVSIAPEIAGRVVARPVSESDEVQQGDILLKIETTSYLHRSKSLRANGQARRSG